MKLKKEGILHSFYHWSYAVQPPNDLCNFFWWMIWAVIWLPITWVTFWWKDNHPKDGLSLRLAVGMSIHIGLALLVFFIYELVINPWSTLIMSGYITGVITVITLTFVSYMYYTKTAFADEVRSVLSERKKSIKQNYCPKIDWE